MILRPYQTTFIDDIRASLGRHRHTLAVLPTGGGKTAVASFMAQRAHQKGRKIMFTCHRDFLVEQTAETFADIGLPYTFIAAGRDHNPYEQVVIASIDTLKRRLDTIEPPDLLIVDEAVHAAAAGWATVIEHFQSLGCLTIGLTACPDRLSRKGLRKWFADMVVGPTTADLIGMGFLSAYKAFAPSQPDLTGVPLSAGDYAPGAINERMDKPAITGNIVHEYQKIAPGLQGLTFCCSIKHSQNMAIAFRAAGFEACHIGADTPKSDRAEMLRDYRLGRIKMLTSVDIFNEGFNVPAASYAALARPTKSLSIFLQQCGRVLRADKDKDFAFISDHAANIGMRIPDGSIRTLHGFPDDARAWTLDDREKRRKGDDEPTIAVRQCTQCFFAHRPSPFCPECGHVYEITAREIEEREGELIELQRQEKKMELWQARTRADLWKIARARGYEAGWVFKQAKLRNIKS